MEPPATFEADALRDEKVKVLRAIARADARPGRGATSSAASTARLGRRQAGRRATARSRRSTRSRRPETFVAARLEVDDWRWVGVPVLPRGPASACRSGRPEIAIQFKDVPHRLFRDSTAEPEPNLLAMRIQPDEGIMLRFARQGPGLGIDVRSVTHGLHLRLGVHGRLARRLRDADPRRAARRRLAVHPGRTRSRRAWSIVTPIIETWASSEPPAFPQLRRARLPGGPEPSRTNCRPAMGRR